MFLRKTKKITVFSPMEGSIVDLSQVPDEAFSSGIIGDGVAINPLDNSSNISDASIYAPCDAPCVHFFETNHAISFEVNSAELIVHLGIDTVKLKGKGFERIGDNDRSVKKGDLLVKCDIAYLKKNAKSVISPIVISNMEIVKSIEKATGKVNVGDFLFEVTLQ